MRRGGSIVAKRRGPRWSRVGECPCAHAAGGSNDPKADEAPTPMRRESRWSQSERAPCTNVTGASVVPIRMMPRNPFGGNLGHRKAAETPAGLQQESQRLQREESLRAHAPRGLSGPKTKNYPRPCGGGPDQSVSTECPRAHAAKAMVVPKHRRCRHPCNRGLDDYNIEGSPRTNAAGASVVPNRLRPAPIRRGPW